MVQTANINIKKLNPDATIPTYGSDFAAGADDLAVLILRMNTVFHLCFLLLIYPCGLG